MSYFFLGFVLLILIGSWCLGAYKTHNLKAREFRRLKEKYSFLSDEEIWKVLDEIM